MMNTARTLIAVAATALISASAIAPAYADEHWRRHHEREWREEQARRDYEWRIHHGYAPYYASPPPVVYAPAPSPGINLIVPLNIR
jgi:hypothetical protein